MPYNNPRKHTMKFKRFNRDGGLLVALSPKEGQLPAASSAPASPPVFQLKRILVPMDFSTCSEKALAYAVPFAKQFGAELTLLHVVQPYPPVPGMAPLDGELIPDLEKRLEVIRSTVDAEVPSEAMLLRGDPHLEIAKAAEKFGADLIILSTHGRTGLAHVLLGSTAERVVRHAGCPVLVLREHQRDFINTNDRV